MKQEDHEMMEKIFGEDGPDDSMMEQMEEAGLEELNRLHHLAMMLDGFIPALEEKVQSGQFFVLSPPNNMSFMLN